MSFVGACDLNPSQSKSDVPTPGPPDNKLTPSFV